LCSSVSPTAAVRLPNLAKITLSQTVITSRAITTGRFLSTAKIFEYSNFDLELYLDLSDAKFHKNQGPNLQRIIGIS